MSAKGEKYKSKSAKMKHEKMEGAKERMMEYGSKKAGMKKSAAKKKASSFVKKPAAKKDKVAKVMGEFKEGTLHAGKGGRVVRKRKQAIAIALSEAGKAKKKEIMSTVAQLINRTQRQILSGTVEERNKLAAALSATATSVTFQYELNGIRAGSIIQVDSELMYCWEVNIGSKTATVERAFNGTVAVAHLTNAYIIVNPRFPRAQILEAINDELSDLSSPMNGLFRIKSVDINYNGSDRMINFPVLDDVIDLAEVRIRYLSTDYIKVPKVSLTRNLPTSDFGSGIALTLNQTVRSGILRVSYKTGFGKLINETDDIQTISGYPQYAEDILVIGAQIRLVSPREIKRNFTESQGEPRRSDEVTAGAVGSSITNLLRMRRDRITAEAAKLNRQYPVMLSKV